jgi:glycosyltransferase involved in cell wall biosynthesis
MHILFLPSWYPLTPEDINGCFFREQAIILSRAGHQVGVLSFHGNRRDRFANPRLWAGQLQAETDMGVQTWRIHHPSGIRGYGKIILPRLVNHFFQKYCRAHRTPDILHAQSALTGGVQALQLSRRHGIPCVVTEHSSAYLRQLMSHWMLAKAQTVFCEADAVLAVSSPLADAIKKACPLTKEIRIVPNILNEGLVKAARPGNRKTPDRFTFLNVALLTQNKKQDLLIKAFAESFSGKPVQLLIGGYGEEQKNLERLIAELNMTSQIQLLGGMSRQEVLSQMMQCDAFVLSSLFETFGVVLIEALACGKPVVATACGGPEDIVTMENGILVEKNSIAALADGMTSVFEKIDQYEPDRIKTGCIEKFGEKAVAEKLTGIYKQCLARQTIEPG